MKKTLSAIAIIFCLTASAQKIDSTKILSVADLQAYLDQENNTRKYTPTQFFAIQQAFNELIQKIEAVKPKKK